MTFSNAESAQAALSAESPQLEDGTPLTLSREKDSAEMKKNAEKRRLEEDVEREIKRRREEEETARVAQLEAAAYKAMRSRSITNDTKTLRVSWAPKLKVNDDGKAAELRKESDAEKVAKPGEETDVEKMSDDKKDIEEGKDSKKEEEAPKSSEIKKYLSAFGTVVGIKRPEVPRGKRVDPSSVF